MAAGSPTVAGSDSFPALILEWSPTTNPGDPPVWVNITSRLRRFSITRGRRNWLSQMTPGQATFDLDNTDGAFTPANSSAANYPNVIPGKRVRLRCAFGGTMYNRYAGFTTGYPTTWKNTDSQVTLTCVDGLSLLNLVSLPSIYGQAIVADGPTAFYRFQESSGTAIAADSSGLGHTAVYSASGVSYGVAGPISETTSKALTFDGLTGVVTTRDQYSLSINWSVEAWFLAAASIFAVSPIIASDLTLYPRWQCSLDPSFGGEIAFNIVYADGTTLLSSTIKNGLADGKWHHIVATWNSANVLTVYVDGVLDTFGFVPPAGFFPTRPLTIGPGNSLSTVFSIGEVAIWSGVTLTAAQVAAHYAARTSWLGDRSDVRIGKVLDSVGWLPTDRSIQQGSSVLAAADDYAGKSPLAAVNDVATTENGLAFINQAGQLTFLGRGTLQTVPYNTSQGTFGDNAAEIAYPMGDGKLTVDDQDLWTQFQVQKHGGALFTARAPQATINRFYTVRQPATVNTLTSSDFEAPQLANWLLNQSSVPAPRVDTINMKGTAGNLASILAPDLGALVTYKGRPAGVGTVSQAARILGMKESADMKERIWHTSWLLFAREPQAMVWDDPTYGKWDTYPWGI